MAGLSAQTPIPSGLVVHQVSRVLELQYDEGVTSATRFRLSFEYLRVESPSAEVRGHGPGQEKLQVGKRDVTISSIEPVGHYGVKLVFSDGHDSGIYSWDYLHELATQYESRWNNYLAKLEQTGQSRDTVAR